MIIKWIFCFFDAISWFSFFGFSSVAARFFFRRRPGPSSVAAPVLPPLSRYFCPQPSGLSVLAAGSLSRPA